MTRFVYRISKAILLHLLQVNGKRIESRLVAKRSDVLHVDVRIVAMPQH